MSIRISESYLVGMNIHSNCRRSHVVNYNPRFAIARPKRLILSWLCRSAQCYNKIIVLVAVMICIYILHFWYSVFPIFRFLCGHLVFVVSIYGTEELTGLYVGVKDLPRYFTTEGPFYVYTSRRPSKTRL